jgi:hypothetical protein
MTTKLRCYNKGCGKDYYEGENEDGACLYHSGVPVFNDLQKGWSCCQRRVVDFDDFLQIAGCTLGKHSSQKPKPAEAPEAKITEKVNLVSSEGDVEIYSTGTPIQKNASNPSSSSSSSTATKSSTPRPTVPKQEEKLAEPEDDPADFQPTVGMSCKRKSCNHIFDGGNKDTECIYHSGEPIFHEGSKGWSCCSRKVLEFEEFLKIKGCKTGKHKYTEQKKPQTQTQVQCRTDWYQTQTSVFLSIFAKSVNKEASKITFEPFKLNVSVVFANGDIFEKQFYLFEEINPEECKISFMSVKIEVTLAKANGLSWAALEATEKIVQWTTFGVQGRVGTIGSKEVIYAGDSPIVNREKS